MCSRFVQVEIAVIAPQFEWPQITMSLTPSTAIAYSTVADTPPGSGPYDGTMLPALRITNSEPGSVCVSSSGTTRLSEQVTKSVLGFCAVDKRLKSALCCGKTSRWKR